MVQSKREILLCTGLKHHQTATERTTINGCFSIHWLKAPVSVWSFDLLLTLTSHVKHKNKSQLCLSLILISDLKMQRKILVQTLKELCLENI